MERRNFFKLAFGAAAGAALLAASAQAAPVSPQSLGAYEHALRDDGQIRPAVVSTDEVDRLAPEQVHWGRGHHWGWRHRHWGWHRGWRHHHHW